MRGTVAHGDKRGRTLGFPTANLVPDSALVVPGHGVYACRARGRRRAPRRGGQRRRAPDVPDRARAAGGGVPARLRRRHLRRRSCGWTSSSACAARSASTTSTRSWSRCTATSTRRAASPLDSLTKVRDMDAIEQVRSFNRVVTRRVGALEDTYLARGRPLGASARCGRSAPPTTDLRALRARLGARLRLSEPARRRRWSARGWSSARPHAGRPARARGPAHRRRGAPSARELDRASDALAASLLAPLGERQRERLVEAMATVERLLTAGLVEVAAGGPPRAADAQRCLASLLRRDRRALRARLGPAAGIRLDAADMAPPRGLLLLARLDGEPIGCGVLWHHGGGIADAKRMWVAPAARGLGVGRRLLAELERHAPRGRRAHAAAGHQPRADARRSGSTAPPASRRSSASTTSRTPTTGSRSRLG